jgi:hypothetical protein
MAHNQVLQTLGKICRPYVYENSAHGKQFAKCQPQICSMTHIFILSLEFCGHNLARWHHCHEQAQCYATVSCSPFSLVRIFNLSKSFIYTTFSLFQKRRKNNCVQKLMLS